ncbi:MAG: hypothetical protein IPP88_22215 [Betaproteobacteria bacterium]|nr:hypothetical protein [Betaproteobacteria bacterium]
MTIVTAGTCIIAADQAGNTTYAAASQVPQSIVINKASQAVLTATATPLTLAIGQTAALATTGGTGTGAVTFTSNNANCTIASTTLTAALAGGCTVTATKAADTNYNPATATVAVTTSLNAQTITFGANPGPVTHAPAGTFTVSATGGGSLNWSLLVPPPAGSAPPVALTAPP